MTTDGDGLGATAGSAASVIRVTEAVYSELISMAKGPVESAAVLLAQVDGEGTATQIVVTAVHPVPDYAYHRPGCGQFEKCSRRVLSAWTLGRFSVATNRCSRGRGGASSMPRASQNDDDRDDAVSGDRGDHSPGESIGIDD